MNDDEDAEEMEIRHIEKDLEDAASWHVRRVKQNMKLGRSQPEALCRSSVGTPEPQLETSRNGNKHRTFNVACNSGAKLARAERRCTAEL